MSDFVSLLPPNATAIERALEAATARIGETPVPIRDLWNADTCPLVALPALAWAFSVDVWDSEWTEAQKRTVVREAIAIHRIKGSPASIRRALTAAGYGDAEISEGPTHYYADGELRADGAEFAGLKDHWAEFRVIMKAPVAVDAAPYVRAVINRNKPARSHLKHLSFEQTAYRANGVISADGEYSAGVI